MRINFYDTRIEDYKTVLIKEKAVNYKTVDIREADIVTELLNTVVSLNTMGECKNFQLQLSPLG